MLKKLSLIIALIIFVSCGKEAVKEEPSPPKPVKKQEVKQPEKKIPEPQAQTPAVKEEKMPPSMEQPQEAPPEASTVEKTAPAPPEVVTLNPGDYTVFPQPPPNTEEPDLPWDESWTSEPEQNITTVQENQVEEKEMESVEEIKSPAEVLEEAVALVESVPESLDILYMVRPGDYLALIAKKEYADVKMWKSIWFWNREIIGDNPSRIYPFNEFTLKKPPELANPVKYDFYEYVVLPNESLWKIARKEYGNSLAWIVILRDNFDSIGSEHDRIPAGTVLKLRTRLY